MDWNALSNRLRRVRRLLFWLPSGDAGAEQPPEAAHDHALVLSVTSPERMPRWRQIRYVLRTMTMKERRAFLVASGVAILALSATAVSIAAARIVTVPVVGGSLTEALVGVPQHLNPLDAPGNDVDNDLVQLIYSGLFRLDGLEAVPDLTESFQWSDDRKTLTIHLRTDARFHDGEPLTAEDVVFTIESIQDPARKSSLLPAFRGVHAASTDAETVVFTLDHPDPFFLTKLTVGILPAHLWQELPAETARLSDLNLKPVGAGPYRVKSFTRDSQGAIHAYTLERFENAAGFRPYLKTVVFQFFPSQREALDALKADLVDALAFVNPDDVSALGASSRIADIRLELPQETVAFFNMKRALLAHPEVRQALALAVNPKDVQDALRGSGAPVDGPYPFETRATSTGFSPTFDLDRARLLLQNAGWVLPENGNVRTWKPPATKTTTTKKGKKTVVVTPATSASSTELALTISVAQDSQLIAVADVLKRSWSLIGVRVTVDVLSTEDLMRRATRDRNGDVILLNILLPPDQDLLPFWWSGQAVDRGVNISGLSDRTVDAALERVRSATSTDDLHAARAAATNAILQTTPALFLSRPVTHYLVSKKIRGLPETVRAAAPAERFQAIERWYRNTGWRWK